MLNSIDYLSPKMVSNVKTLSYKIVDVIESYNFHIKFTSSELKKKLQFFENRRYLSHGGCRCYSTPGTGIVATAVPTAIPHDSRGINLRSIYFCKIEVKKM
jgi:hypothetical protein